MPECGTFSSNIEMHHLSTANTTANDATKHGQGFALSRMNLPRASSNGRFVSRIIFSIRRGAVGSSAHHLEFQATVERLERAMCIDQFIVRGKCGKFVQ